MAPKNNYCLVFLQFKAFFYRHFHKMGDLQWAYNRELAVMAGVEGVPQTVETLYNDVTLRRRDHLTAYKDDIYEFIGDKFVRFEK